MEKQSKSNKNHWTQTNVDNATKKINQEIYKRNRQAPIHIKMDDMAIFINDKITRRGIAKGLVFVQEDLNKNILEAEKNTVKALMITNSQEQYDSLNKARQIMKVEIWIDLRLYTTYLVYNFFLFTWFFFPPYCIYIIKT